MWPCVSSTPSSGRRSTPGGVPGERASMSSCVGRSGVASISHARSSLMIAKLATGLARAGSRRAASQRSQLHAACGSPPS
jgi:hypothetical protein